MTKAARSMRPRALGAVVLGIAIVAALPATASASKVSVGSTALKYRGAGIENNIATVSYAAGVYTVNDLGAALTAGNGCTQVDPNTAACTDVGLTYVKVKPGAADDSATVDVTVPVGAMLVGGGGDDVLNGGNGDDKIVSGGGDDTINGGLGSDRLVAGGGADSIDSNDGVADIVNCGGGIDTLVSDPLDTVSGNCP